MDNQMITQSDYYMKMKTASQKPRKLLLFIFYTDTLLFYALFNLWNSGH